MRGKVTRIVRQEPGRKDKGGYFFIRDEQGHDRFAHANDLVDGHKAFTKLKEKDTVEFEPISGKGGNGLRADNVRVTK